MTVNSGQLEFQEVPVKLVDRDGGEAGGRVMPFLVACLEPQDPVVNGDSGMLVICSSCLGYAGGVRPAVAAR